MRDAVLRPGSVLGVVARVEAPGDVRLLFQVVEIRDEPGVCLWWQWAPSLDDPWTSRVRLGLCSAPCVNWSLVCPPGPGILQLGLLRDLPGLAVRFHLAARAVAAQST